MSQISPDSRGWGDLRFVLAASGDGVGHPISLPMYGEIPRQPRTWDRLQPLSGFRLNGPCFSGKEGRSSWKLPEPFQLT